MRTNCVNCGAPIQPNQCACPWCNTPYRLTQVERFITSMDYNYKLELERDRLNSRIIELKSRGTTDDIQEALDRLARYNICTANEIRRLTLLND